MALPIFFDYFTSSNDLCLDIFSNMQALVADRSVTALLTPVQRVAFAQNDTTTAYSFIRHMLAANNQHLFEAVARWVHKNPTQQSLSTSSSPVLPSRPLNTRLVQDPSSCRGGALKKRRVRRVPSPCHELGLTEWAQVAAALLVLPAAVLPVLPGVVNPAAPAPTLPSRAARAAAPSPPAVRPSLPLACAP